MDKSYEYEFDQEFQDNLIYLRKRLGLDNNADVILKAVSLLLYVEPKLDNDGCLLYRDKRAHEFVTLKVI